MPVTRNGIAPLYSLPPAEMFPPPGDSISAECEMGSLGREDIFRPIVEKVAPLIKMSRIEKSVLNDFF